MESRFEDIPERLDDYNVTLDIDLWWNYVSELKIDPNMPCRIIDIYDAIASSDVKLFMTSPVGIYRGESVLAISNKFAPERDIFKQLVREISKFEILYYVTYQPTRFRRTGDGEYSIAPDVFTIRGKMKEK